MMKQLKLMKAARKLLKALTSPAGEEPQWAEKVSRSKTIKF
jgi:hypothetical protein